MPSSIRSLPWLLAAGVLLASCGDASPPAISVGPVSFTEEQLLGLTPDRRRTLADLTAFGLAVADSATLELGTPLVTEWTDDRRLEILAAELTLERNDVGDAVLEAQYLLDPQWELTVRHILFFSERWQSASHRTEAEAKAQRAMESLRAGADFASTAAALSEEPGAEGRQELLTPGRDGSWVPEFWTAALGLEPGGISPVTETQYGYHILRLEDRRVVPFSEARSTIARGVADRIEDPVAVLDAWLEAAASDPAGQRAAGLTEVGERGLSVPDGEHAELLRRWEDQVYQLSTALGFRYGLTPSQVAEAAMAALSNSSQGSDIARRELSLHRHLLDALYVVQIGTDGT